MWIFFVGRDTFHHSVTWNVKHFYVKCKTFHVTCFTGWRRLIGSPKLQIIFHKRATKYRALLRKMTYKDKGSYESSPPCTTLWCFITHINCFLGDVKYVFGDVTKLLGDEKSFLGDEKRLEGEENFCYHSITWDFWLLCDWWSLQGGEHS